MALTEDQAEKVAKRLADEFVRVAAIGVGKSKDKTGYAVYIYGYERSAKKKLEEMKEAVKSVLHRELEKDEYIYKYIGRIKIGK